MLEYSVVYFTHNGSRPDIEDAFGSGIAIGPHPFDPGIFDDVFYLASPGI